MVKIILQSLLSLVFIIKALEVLKPGPKNNCCVLSYTQCDKNLNCYSKQLLSELALGVQVIVIINFCHLLLDHYFDRSCAKCLLKPTHYTSYMSTNFLFTAVQWSPTSVNEKLVDLYAVSSRPSSKCSRQAVKQNSLFVICDKTFVYKILVL